MVNRQARRAFVLTGILASVALIPFAQGCGRKAHDAPDTGALASDAAGATADGVNAGDVERFPEEVTIDHVAAKITQATIARLTIPLGSVVIGLDPGTDVQKLAAHAGFVLVSFADPKTQQKTMGWIPQEAVSGGSAGAPGTGGGGGNGGGGGKGGGGGGGGGGHVHDAGIVATLDAGGKAAVTPIGVDAGKAGPKKTCAAGQALAKVGDAEDCLKICKSAADCPTNSFCTTAVLADPPGHSAKLCFKTSN